MVGYEDYLNAQGLARNTINYYLRNFRTIYNSSIRDGFKPKSENPFTYIQTKPCKTIKRAINKDDMKKLSSLILPVHSGMDIARDMYLFSFYAQGMAFVDIVFLKKKNIRDGILSYRRHKSQQLIHIVVTPQMQGLIDKYANDSEYVFPIIDTSLSTSIYDQYRLALGRVNRYLKKNHFSVKYKCPADYLYCKAYLGYTGKRKRGAYFYHQCGIRAYFRRNDESIS